MKMIFSASIVAALAAGLAAGKEPTLPQFTVASDRFQMGFQLVTFDVNGASPRLVEGVQHAATNPDWSPDGKQLLFTTAQTGHLQIYLLDVATGATRKLTDTAVNEHQPRWSPDGKRIMFTSERDGNHEIYVMAADGSQPQNLTRDGSFDSDPAWSPDGKRILFGSNRRGGSFRLYVMNSDGSGLKQAVEGVDGGWTNPAWSPDGQQMLFSGYLRNGSCQVFVANADGQGVEALTEGPGANSFASWSRDGAHIAYLHFDKPIEASPEGGRLIVIELETGQRREVAPEGMHCAASRIAWPPQSEGR